jgi:hypothetical protein
VAYRIYDEKSEGISDREEDCQGAWQLIERAMSSRIEKRAMLNPAQTGSWIMLFLAYVCPQQQRAVGVRVVHHPSTSPQ